MRMRTKPWAAIATVVGAVLTGCSSGAPGASISSAQMGIPGKVAYGTVVSVRPTVIGGQSIYMPGLGVAGMVMTKAMTKQAGQEITIQLDGRDRQAVVVIQATPPEFVPGEQVKVTISGGNQSV